ncbi:MAG: hypothetical protein KF791_04505 [Verrucomicrobiae bacterium]|nr:hypothetical protein [Verrucomicrobiae bacterium]
MARSRSSPNDPLPLRAARVLRALRGLDEGEKSLHALGLAATPEERWALWEKQIRSNGFWKPFNGKASNASSSACRPRSPKG